MSRKFHLLAIDCQRDFCLPNRKLSVPGADDDMDRAAQFITNNLKRIDDISCTLDSHYLMHIAHPMMWTNSSGQHPAPFTLITADDYKNGVWRMSVPLRASDGTSWAKYYLDQLEKNSRYVLCIWPPHCIIGSEGHAFHPDFEKAINEWQTTRIAVINAFTKGSDIRTEHYSAVKADVEIPDSPGTQLNMHLISLLQDPDTHWIGIVGEALSHCVANTVRDIASNFGDDNIKKLVLFRDCCSSVPGFEAQGEAFISEMTAKGMQITTTADFSF